VQATIDCKPHKIIKKL